MSGVQAFSTLQMQSQSVSRTYKRKRVPSKSSFAAPHKSSQNINRKKGSIQKKRPKNDDNNHQVSQGKPKSIGEAVQQAQTVSELLEVASQLWLPTDADLPGHLRTQAVHHERRQRWSAQLLSKLGESCLTDSKGNLCQDPRLARAVMAAALPFPETSSSSSQKSSEKDARIVREALLGIHTLVCHTYDKDFRDDTVTAHADFLSGVQRLLERAETMTPTYSLNEAMEVRWAARGILTRLGNQVAPLSVEGVAEGDKPAFLASSFPQLENRVGAIPFDILPLGVDFTNLSGWNSNEQDGMSSADDERQQHDTMASLQENIPFQFDTIVTRHGSSVTERRGTAWVAEEGIGALAYSGKLMAPSPIPVLVRRIMRQVEDAIDAPMVDFFDCALCNYYPDGDSACKFHQDPEHGKMWERLCCVVAMGSPRRFAFRPVPGRTTWSQWDAPSHHRQETDDSSSIAAAVRLFPGDVVIMWGRCNDDFHHAVFQESESLLPHSAHSTTDARRVSLVFKRAIAYGNDGRRGHGLLGRGRRHKRS